MTNNEIKTYCSLIADYYYNRKRKVIGSQVEKIVSEIERLCKQGKFEVSVNKLISIVKRRYPEVREGRIPEVIGWAKNNLPYSLIREEGGKIAILQCLPGGNA